MTTPNLTDWRERQYVSQFAQDLMGLAINVNGAPGNADAGVTYTVVRESDSTTVASGTATTEATGLYEFPLPEAVASVTGNYTITWSYAIGGNAETYQTWIVVGLANPAYDALPPEMKAIVDSVWLRFADLFDSPYGGPNLQTYFQTNWSRGRVAQLLRIALGRLNTMAQPYQTFTLDPTSGEFPVAQWGSLLETALYVEALKHLERSYTEQPDFVGGSVTRLDRTKYAAAWKAIRQDEEQVLNSQRDVFKISAMGLGKPRVLVGGGVYGRYGPTRIAGSAATRPRYWTRFY